MFSNLLKTLLGPEPKDLTPNDGSEERDSIRILFIRVPIEVDWPRSIL